MGSPSGLWTAVSGGMAQSQNLDIIANNLANVNTTGFKKDQAVFKEYLTAVERPPSPAIDIPRTVFKDSDFYHTDGAEHAMVNVDRVHTDHAQGNLKVTNSPFDMAVDGQGFFAVQTASGVAYTRAGDFKLSSDGILVTTDGLPVLGLSQAAQTPMAQGRGPANVNPFVAAGQAGVPGQPAAQASAGTQPSLVSISLRNQVEGGRKIHVTPEGEIYSDADLVGRLAVAEFVNPGKLQKTGSALFVNPDATNVPRVATSSRIRQGFLESSNVNPVSELVELLKANRMFESNMKAIKAYNDMAGKEANEVGKL